MKESFIGKIVRTLATSGITILLGIITSIIIARSLGPAGKGAYVIIIQTISIFIALGQFGLPEVLLHQLGAKNWKLQDFAGVSFLLLIVSTLLIGAILLIVYPILSSSIFKDIDFHLIKLTFLMVPFSLAFIFYNRLIQLRGHIGIYNLMRISNAVISLISLLVWLQFWQNQIQAALLALISSQALVAVLSIYLFRRNITKDKWTIKLRLLWEVIRNGMKVQFGMVVVILGDKLGIFVLNMYMDLSAVGWFSLSIAISHFLLLFSISTRDVLQSWMTGEEHTSKEVLEKTTLLIRNLIILLLGGSLILAIVGRPLINIVYGIAFIPAYTPMLVLLIGIIARGLGQIFSSYLALQNYLGLPSISAFIGVSINLLLALWLVPQNGIIGAAIATMAGQLVSLLFLMVCFIRITDCSIFEFVPGVEDIRHSILALRKMM